MATCGDYWDTSYEDANLARAVCDYNYTAEKLNQISETYNGIVNSAVDLFSEAAVIKGKAKSLGIIGMWEASIGLYGRANVVINLANDSLEQARVFVGDSTLHVNPYFGVYGTMMENGAIYYGIAKYIDGNNSTYSQLVARHDNLLDIFTNYSSFSFSLSIGTDGTSSFIIDAATLSSFVNITLQLANDIGIISDDTYDKLVSSPLWQLAINVTASAGLSYGMSNLGYTSTSLGYLDNATTKAMFTSDIDAIFNTINVLQSVYNTYGSYEDLQDAKDDLERQRNEADEFLANLSKDKKEFHDTEVYATGEYYRKFAGQDLFNVGLPGHAGYVPTSAQIPSWGIVQENLHDSDEFVSQVMNQNRNGSMAGGASFFKTITEGAIGS